jgi:hypothetical protein
MDKADNLVHASYFDDVERSVKNLVNAVEARHDSLQGYKVIARVVDPITGEITHKTFTWNWEK